MTEHKIVSGLSHGQVSGDKQYVVFQVHTTDGDKHPLAVATAAVGGVVKTLCSLVAFARRLRNEASRSPLEWRSYPLEVEKVSVPTVANPGGANLLIDCGDFGLSIPIDRDGIQRLRDELDKAYNAMPPSSTH